ncbi:hypothetical protein IT397_01790 [Candidatus Nomurabacteria bacterium]|nr:hypothetical protein [Candidatus Nomurabacteria bacterium]
MKKMIYFFVDAQVGFEKQYPKQREYPELTDKRDFHLKEIFGIEQKPDEPDDIFYQNLKAKIQEAIELCMTLWLKKEKTDGPTVDWEWKLGHREIQNISKVS